MADDDDRNPQSFGPYLRYAIASDFRHFELFDDLKFKLLLLIKFRHREASEPFLDRMKRLRIQVELGPSHERALHMTVRAEKAAVSSTTFDIWNDLVDSAELSLPVMPTQPEPSFARMMPLKRWDLDGEPAAEVLLGVIDDGCPFAAAQFRKISAGAAAGTRVRGIWDQNQPRDLVPVTDPNGKQHVFGQALPDFQYGAEFWRNTLTTGSTSQMGLNDWIGLHATKYGSTDEDGCYAESGFNTLKQRASHGAHIMDVLAGRLPPSSRVGAPPDYRDPPSFAPGSDIACDTDLVFVQFPDGGLGDATGVWLKAYVIDAINYILSFADPQRTKRVIVNLSYGPTTGPHDGSAELEQALKEFVDIYDGHGLPRLQIFLPDGNAYLSEGHVAHKREPNDPHHVSWKWRIPPDNTVLCFAEVWMKTSEVQPTTTVTLTSPGGTIFSAGTGPTGPTPGGPVPPYTGVFRPQPWGNDTMWLLAVEPTIATGQAAPEHGDWTIKVENLKPRASLHAYVARSDPNMGVRSGARRSYFVDADWESRFGAAAGCTYIDGKFAKTGSLIEREGTLNGIATDNVAGIQVAGGYILRHGRKSPYASAGPSRKTRRGPDFALFCDQSYALAGVRAGGNRSGGVFRLTGTSAAAPQLARWATRSRFPRQRSPATSRNAVAATSHRPDERAEKAGKLRLFAHFGRSKGCRSGPAALPRASEEPRP